MSLTPKHLNLEAGTSRYLIDNSLLCDGVDDYLARTPPQEGNRKQWTFSAWVKCCDFTKKYQLLTAAESGIEYYRTEIRIVAGELRILQEHGAHNYQIDLRTALNPDSSGHFHLVVAVDTTAPTNSDRVIITINGQRATSFSTAVWPVRDLETYVGRAVPHYIAAGYKGFVYCHYNGYIAEAILVDGLGHGPEHFGKQSALADNHWEPVKPRVSDFGPNGFWLDFEDGANLGKDVSGRGNHWTVSGCPEQTVDTPTNNLAVLATGTALAVTHGNRRAQGVAGGYYDSAALTINPRELSAKWAIGLVLKSISQNQNGHAALGMVSPGQGLAGHHLGINANSFGALWIQEGIRTYYVNNPSYARVTMSNGPGSRVVLLGDEAGRVYLAGISAGSSTLIYPSGVDPVAGTGAYPFSIPDDWLLAVHCYDATDIVELDQHLADVSLPDGYAPLGALNKNAQVI